MGLGECSPLPGLSMDDIAVLPHKLNAVCEGINTGVEPRQLLLRDWPSIQFAVDCALLDLENGGRGVLFENDFTRGRISIATNGLIHMNEPNAMLKQLLEKSAMGFKCIKVKVGALDFDRELRFLKEVREICPAPDFELRLDANGAFEPDTAMAKLNELAAFQVHSLEQPLRPGQWHALRDLTESSPIPIALDEELIGISSLAQMQDLLAATNPGFIVLKPTLLGGFAPCRMWIEVALDLGIGFWVTSILESNIGLSALCQWTAGLNLKLTQGLGTGRLFDRNFDSGVRLQNAGLCFRPEQASERPPSLFSFEPTVNERI